MNGHAREGQERGRGVPLRDAERVARHYGFSVEQAEELLEKYPVSELIPERGYGLGTRATPTSVIGYSASELPLALTTMEGSLKNSQHARLTICSQELPTEEDLARFYLQVVASGHHSSRPKARLVRGIPTTELVLTKGSPQWALLIPLIPIALITGLITFGLTRIETISKAIMPVLLVAIGGTVVLVGLLARPAERVAVKYLEKGPALSRLPQTEPKKALAVK